MIGARFAIYTATVFILPACDTGPGSDIGPKLPVLPPVDYRVLIRDDAQRPVTGATLRVSGEPTTAASGTHGRVIFRSSLSMTSSRSIERSVRCRSSNTDMSFWCGSSS